jgi:hypothetical protein
MGYLQYGNDQYEFDDRLLAHMKLAIVAKLLRHESFLLNWTIPADKGSGRISLWVSRESHLTFRFSGSRPPNINPRWIEALSLNAARTGGMLVIGEDEVDTALAVEEESAAQLRPAPRQSKSGG